MQLYIWRIVDTIAEYAEAIAIAETVEQAIGVVVASVDDEDFQKELRQELTENEPEVHRAPCGYYSESPT